MNLLRTCTVAAALCALGVSTGFSAPGYLGWTDSVMIKINTDTTAGGTKIGGKIDNFPLLIKLTPENFTKFSSVAPQGTDIRFGALIPALGGGLSFSRLPYYIEKWEDVAGDFDTASIWVRVPSIQPNDSTQNIKMYFGRGDTVDASNSGKVFDTSNGYLGVWPLNESQTGTGKDSLYKDLTFNKFHGKDSVSSAPVKGVAGNAAYFNGTGDALRIQKYLTSADTIRNSFGIMAWVKSTTINTGNGIIISQGTGGANTSGTYLCLDRNGSKYNCYLKGHGINDFPEKTEVGNADNTVIVNTWQFVSVQWTEWAFTIYLNTLFRGNQNPPWQSTGVRISDQPLFFGKMSDRPGEMFNGSLDQVVFYKGVLSPDYLALTYATQRPDTASIVTITPLSASNAKIDLQSKARFKNTSTVSFNTIGSRAHFTKETDVYNIYGRKVSGVQSSQGIVIVKSNKRK